MWPKSEQRPRWQRNFQRVLTAALALAGVYLVWVFAGRSRQPDGARPAPKLLPLSPDYWVLPPKSYARSLADVRAWVGKPLWVREGYRYTCTPGPDTLGPMEKVVARRAFERRGQVWLEFARQGRPCAIAVSAGERFYLDEIFLIQDPHEVYQDWTPETWKKIAERRIEPGMTETQITFALGFGVLVRDLSREGDANRAVDYTGGEKHLRVTYQYGVAKWVAVLP